MSDIKKSFHLLVVDKVHSNSSLSKFIQHSLSVPFSLLSKISRLRKIKVNNKVITDLKYKIFEKDQIQIFYNILSNKDDDHRKNRLFPEKKILDILSNKIYEDENLLCLNKPRGISVQDGTNVGYDFVKSIEYALKEKFFIVHRIDKETSGIFLLAKNLKTAQEISELFKNNEIKKEYLAVVNPIPKQESAVISDPIYVEGVRKDSKTSYRILKKDLRKDVAVLIVNPETGRKHQIRIHLSKIGSPIVGDKKYFGNMKISKKLKLFANKITIPHFGTFSVNFDLDEIQN